MAEVVDGGQAVMRDFVYVESELGLHMLMLAFGVVYFRAIFGAELGELDSDGEVYGGGVSDGVSDVVGQGTDGEGELVGVGGVAKEIYDKVAGADVVGEVGVGDIAKGVVADVLDDAAAVGVGARLFELGRGEVGVAAEEEGDDGVFPGEVNELLVGEKRVSVGLGAEGKREQEEWDGEEASQLGNPFDPGKLV